MIGRIRLVVALCCVALSTLLLVPFQILAMKTGWYSENLPAASGTGSTSRRWALRIHQQGAMTEKRPLLIASNHISWTDIEVMASLFDISFIAKSDVDGWPLIGKLFRLQRPVFVERNRKRKAGEQASEIARRLAAGQPIVLFAEGSTGDGNMLLPFKSTLFGAAGMAIAEGTAEKVYIQPVAIAYTRIHGIPMGRQHRPLVSWIGDAELGAEPQGPAVAKAPSTSNCISASRSNFRPDSNRKDDDARGRSPGPRDDAGGASRSASERLSDMQGRIVCFLSPKGARSRRMELDNTIERGIGAPAETAGATKKVFVKTYGCQMNVYDSQRMTDALAADGYAATDTIEDADLVLLNTCHIREKAAEKVYSELGRIRGVKAERRRAGRETIIGVAGCVAQAEGARDHPPRAGGRPGDRPADLSPAARRAQEGARRRKGRRDRLCGRGQVRASAERRGAPRSSAARRHRVPHRAGRLRQVLHLLRRALYARLRSVAAGRADRRRGRTAGRGRRARGHAARPERQRLARRGTGRRGLGPRPAAVPARRNPRPRPAALHHQPPARHGRRTDRRASRPRRADALPASAGAVAARTAC